MVLAKSVAFGPVIKTVRVTFPTNAWYASPGFPAYFGTTVTPLENAAEVTYTSSDPSIALATGSGTNLTVAALTNGTVQVQARVGSQICASKSLSVVGVRMSPSGLMLCVGQSGTITATVNPSNPPVTFRIGHPSIASLTQNGNQLTVSCLATGSTYVVAWLESMFVGVAPVQGIQVVNFPAQPFYVPVGGTNILVPQLYPSPFATRVSYASSDPSIAAVVSVGPGRGVAVRGITNGTTTITSKIGTNQICASKLYSKGHSGFSFPCIWPGPPSSVPKCPLLVAGGRSATGGR